MIKYSIITYIFGKNKELLREPLVNDDSIEYLCITDQKDLKSKYWKIIYDEVKDANCTRDKMVYVKYNPFKYTDADIICVIDGSLEIKNSIIPLFEKIKDNDLLLKKHPERNNLKDEINAWIKSRNLSNEYLPKFQIMAKKEKIDLNKNFLIESCIILYKNKKEIKDFCKKVITYMTFLGKDNNLFLSNQCVLTLLLQLENFKIDYIDQKNFFNRYKHATNIINKL